MNSDKFHQWDSKTNTAPFFFFENKFHFRYENYICDPWKKFMDDDSNKRWCHV